MCFAVACSMGRALFAIVACSPGTSGLPRRKSGANAASFMSKPRLIFVNRVYWPATAATAQLLTDLAEGLAARGWTVHVVAAGEASTRHDGVTIHRTGDSEHHGGLLSRLANYGRFRSAARRILTGLLQSGAVVVVMTDPPLLGPALAKSVATRGASLVHWVQDIYPEIAIAHFGALAGLAMGPL